MQLVVRIYTEKPSGGSNVILEFDAESIDKLYLLECLEMVKRYMEQYKGEDNVHSE